MISPFLLTVLLASPVQAINPAPAVTVKVQRVDEEKYALLSKGSPVTLTVNGPAWVRVYTRIPYYPNEKGAKSYKLILSENDDQERFINLETERSSVAKLDGLRLGKWRSFYINAPEGRSIYRITLWRSPNDTVLVRVANEAPSKWQDRIPMSYQSRLELVEDEVIINYYEATQLQPVVLEIDGPRKIKVLTRLHFATATEGEQLYGVTVKEQGKTIKNVTFRTERSQTTTYRNRSDLVPGAVHSFFLSVKKGKHRLEFQVQNAPAAGFRFQAEER